MRLRNGVKILAMDGLCHQEIILRLWRIMFIFKPYNILCYFTGFRSILVVNHLHILITDTFTGQRIFTVTTISASTIGCTYSV